MVAAKDPDRGPLLGAGFRAEFLDFRRGIRVGNLEPHERITRILKSALEERFGQPFLTERYGRGVYWRWIAWLPRACRAAKPLSHGTSFGCSKYFIMLETQQRKFRAGLQVERGYLKAPPGARAWQLAEDWDWIRLLAALKLKGTLEREIRRLLREGFRIFGGSWESEAAEFSARDYPGAAALRRALERAPARQWAGFQLYYPMTEDDVRASDGADLVEAILAVFDEVTPAMNMVAEIPLRARGKDLRV
ncbi:MAG: hypothetical protein RMK57_01855 [Bryobacterales bacterium]|nr:hypothetical protein [Bryobacteraceae bacterium]MDW8353248.1 hypothetical protein [Bryobacterales bacterium]